MARQDEIDEYVALIGERDSLLQKTRGLQKSLDEANVAVQEAQAYAMGLSEKLSKVKGGENWLKLKSRIAFLAMRGAGRQVKNPNPPTDTPPEASYTWLKQKFFR